MRLFSHETLSHSPFKAIAIDVLVELSTGLLDISNPHIYITDADLPDVSVDADLPDVSVDADLPDVSVDTDLPDVSVDTDLPDASVDTESQTTAWNGGDFSDVKYPLPLHKNETEPLYQVHSRDKRQTAQGGMIRTQCNIIL